MPDYNPRQPHLRRKQTDNDNETDNSVNKQSRLDKLLVWTTTNLLNYKQNEVSAAKDDNDNEHPESLNQVNQVARCTKPNYILS